MLLPEHCFKPQTMMSSREWEAELKCSDRALIGTFRLDYEYEIEYENEAFIKVMNELC